MLHLRAVNATTLDLQLSGYRPDGRWHDVVVEIKRQVHSFRNLRANLLQLAYYLAQEPGARGLLVLLDSRISDERLQKELRLAEQTLRPELARRLFVALERNGRFHGLPEDLGADFRDWLREAIGKESGAAGRRKQSPEAVFMVLLHQWLLGKGPMTAKSIMKTVGCSHPTVANALRRLGPVVERLSDRRVQLRYFPHEEWARLVANSADVRATRRFTDRSGQRRSAESLLRRMAKLQREDIAVGGVLGARYHYPGLDILGTARLDLSLHTPARRADWTFIERLDPGLREAERAEEPIVLAVHLVTREKPLFEPSKEGLAWADPVECLLDLHEAHLEPQAQEFLHHFSSRHV